MLFVTLCYSSMGCERYLHAFSDGSFLGFCLFFGIVSFTTSRYILWTGFSVLGFYLNNYMYLYDRVFLFYEFEGLLRGLYSSLGDWSDVVWTGEVCVAVILRYLRILSAMRTIWAHFKHSIWFFLIPEESVPILVIYLETCTPNNASSKLPQVFLLY